MFINIQFISAQYSENGDQAIQDSGRVPPKFKTIFYCFLVAVILAYRVSINIWYQKEVKLNILYLFSVTDMSCSLHCALTEDTVTI
jgi:hypothetical protein